jgi:hypothetical protein
VAIQEPFDFDEFLFGLSGIAQTQPPKAVYFVIVNGFGHTTCIADIQAERQKANFAKGSRQSRQNSQHIDTIVKMLTVWQILPPFSIAFHLACCLGMEE